MAFSFAPTYQDYRNYIQGQFGNGSEGGGPAFMSQDDWNALGSAGQWNNIGGGLALGANDSRYADLAQQLGIKPGTSGPDATIMLGGGGLGNRGGLVDPSRALSGDDGSWAIQHSNLTPAAEFAGGGLSDRGWVLSALALIGGGAALGGALGGAGAGAEAGGGSIVGNAGMPGYAGAFDAEGFAGVPGMTAGEAGAAGGTAGGSFVGLDGGVGNPYGPGAFDSTGFSGTALDPAAAGSSSNLLSQLNRGRQYFNGARSVMNLLSGGNQGASRSGGGMDMSSVLSALFGGNGSSGALPGILGLLAGGHQAFGGGVGTASGAQDVANHASQIADPWGSSGQRGQFSALMTPDRVMSLLSQDPSAVTSNPAYQFDLNQGINAINMGDAAQGTLRSGNRGYELESYGQSLASKYGQQMFQNNLSTLSQLSNLAGVNAGSPAASAASLVNGFDTASNLRNAGINGLFSGGSSNPLTGGMGAIGSLLNSIFGGNGSSGFDMSNFDFGSLPDFNDTSGWNPNDFFSYNDGSDSLADATGAFF